MNELVVLLNREPVGILRQLAGGDLVFAYDDAWRDRVDAYPLSVSIPLTRREHSDSVLRPFLEGLLPDNQAILDRWARSFHVSSRNPFALLQNMGEDCAGAVQFIPPSRLQRHLDRTKGSVEWLNEKDIATRLRDLIEGSGTGRLPKDRGHFSLAGAQPKTALYNSGGRWGVPSGALPTTHILKPPAQQDLDDFDINEHFCLRVAKHLGLEVAESKVERFDGVPAIVVSRYDRQWTANGDLVRLHQEDICQALAVPPLRKYETDGGPGVVDILDLLIRESASPGEDVATLIDTMALNWAIAGTDAHAKNFSLLIGPGFIRLAPLYDIVSALPYPRWIPRQKAKLAMRIGREYLVRRISARHWEGAADTSGLDREPVVQRVREVLEAVPGAVAAAALEVQEEGLHQEIVEVLRREVTIHAQECLRRMG